MISLQAFCTSLEYADKLINSWENISFESCILQSAPIKCSVLYIGVYASQCIHI